jgi:hypothetical protein
MERVYEMNIAGLTRRLPICSVNEHLDIAGFIIFGDVEMTIAASSELLKKVNEFDVIATLVPLIMLRPIITVESLVRAKFQKGDK